MKGKLSRRGFIRGATALGIAAQGQAMGLPLLQKRGGTESTRSVVVIFLRGGADFLNMLIPLRDRYYELKRPGIGIGPEEVLPLDSHWGLHPTLQPLLPLYKSKQFLPLVNTGSPHPTRSHFDAQDFMGYGAPGDRTVRNGWLNRYLSESAGMQSNDFRAIGMQRLLPTSLRGLYPVLAVPDEVKKKRSKDVLDYFEKFYGADGEQASSDEEGDGMDMDREREEGVDIVQSGKVTIETLRRYREIISRAESQGEGYPNTRFGTGMRHIAQLILSGEGLEVAGLDYGAWDHHANQGASDGSQARSLRELAVSLAAFAQHLGEALDQTLVIVMTEFGRTVMENGSGGTDHGHGSGMFLLGGGVRGGTVLGEWSGLATDRLYQGRDLPVTTDFRDVYNAVLRDHMDFKAPKGFFPDYKPKRLKLFS